MLIDSHIHLSHSLYNGNFPFLSMEGEKYCIHRGTREQLIREIRSSGIDACIEPAIDIESNRKLLTLAEEYDGFLFPAVGVHPTRTYQYKIIARDGSPVISRLNWKDRKQLETFANHPRVVAIGETGLDYHLPRNAQHRLRQKLWFLYQLKIAHKNNLPVILHIREADRDAIRILRRYQHYLHGGVCHCFQGSAEHAGIYTGLGLKLGIGGSLLANTPGKNALEQAVIQTPLEYILLETDGPYVKPDCPELPKKQLRKARNTSLILPAVAQRIAELKMCSLEEVLGVTSENALQLFHLAIHTEHY